MGHQGLGLEPQLTWSRSPVPCRVGEGPTHDQVVGEIPLLPSWWRCREGGSCSFPKQTVSCFPRWVTSLVGEHLGQPRSQHVQEQRVKDPWTLSVCCGLGWQVLGEGRLDFPRAHPRLGCGAPCRRGIRHPPGPRARVLRVASVRAPGTCGSCTGPGCPGA